MGRRETGKQSGKICSFLYPPLESPVQYFLNRGTLAEETGRNLSQAIQAYRIAVAQYDRERRFAAQALFRLATCLHKQGKTNEARTYGLRLIREFPDQTNLIAGIQQWLRISTLGYAGAMPGSFYGGSRLRKAQGSPNPATSSLQEVIQNLQIQLQEIQEKLQLYRHDFPNKEELAQTLAALGECPGLQGLLDQIASEEAKLAQLESSYGEEHPLVLKERTILQSLQRQIETRVSAYLKGLEIKERILKGKIKALQNSLSKQLPATPSVSAKESHPKPSISQEEQKFLESYDQKARKKE